MTEFAFFGGLFFFFSLRTRFAVRKRLIPLVLGSTIGLIFFSYVSLNVFSLADETMAAPGVPILFESMLQNLPLVQRMVLAPLFWVLRYAGGAGFIFLYGAIPGTMAVLGIFNIASRIGLQNRRLCAGADQDENVLEGERFSFLVLAALFAQFAWWFALVTFYGPVGTLRFTGVSSEEVVAGLTLFMLTWPGIFNPVYWSFWVPLISIPLLLITTAVVAVGLNYTVFHRGVWGRVSRFLVLAYAFALWFLMCPVKQTLTWKWLDQHGLAGLRPITAYLPFAQAIPNGLIAGCYYLLYSLLFGTVCATVLLWAVPRCAALVRSGDGTKDEPEGA